MPITRNVIDDSSTDTQALDGPQGESKPIGTFLSELWDALNGCVRSATRPRWVALRGYEPYAQRSYEIGSYEYEVMIFKKPVGLLTRINKGLDRSRAGCSRLMRQPIADLAP